MKIPRLPALPRALHRALTSAALLALLPAAAPHAMAQTAPKPSAAATATTPTTTTADAVVLSPFTVNTEKDDGFSATNAGTATKLGLDMKDMAAPYSVMTGEFLAALGITDLQEATNWSTNGSPVVDGQGADQFMVPVMYNVRGALQNVGQQRNFFATAGIGDTYNTERIDFGRGPNAVLFNTGASDVLGGGISATTKRARLDRNFDVISATAGSWDYYRSTLDVNRKLTDRLAVRANAVWQDRGGYMDYQMERRDGLTVTGTYRLSEKSELRLETSHDKVARTNPTFPLLDRLSGWDGRTVFDRPITNAILSTTATPGTPNFLGQTLTQSGQVQGVERYGVDYVYIPGQSTVMNWTNMARTRRADDSVWTPLYSGGRIWSRNGDANLLPFGNASNQSLTPAVTDNGTANGPTILYSTDLPDDRFNNAIANSHFYIPSKRATNMPHQPLFIQWARDVNLGFTHRFSDTLYLEAQADYNRVHNRSINNINGFRDTYIDLNKNLPDGSPNPHFLDPYGQGQERIREQWIDNGALRANLNWIKDLGRWGSYTFNLTGNYVYRRNDNRQKVASVGLAADPREWQGQTISVRNYWNETNRTFLPDSGLPTQLFNRVVDSAGNTASTTNGAYRPRWVMNSWGDSRQQTTGSIFAMAGRYFKNRLIVTTGVRDDRFENYQRAQLRTGSLPSDAAWDGFALDDRYWRPAAPSDWNNLTYIPRDANGNPTSKVPLKAVTRPTITGANGVNIPNPLYANDRFQDDYSNPVRKGGGRSYTAGAVYHLLPWASLKLNYGTNYAIRDAGTFDLSGADAKPENGLAYEAAMAFSFFNGRLDVLPRYYFNRRENRLGTPPTTTPINNLMNRNDYTDGGTSGRNTLGFPDVVGQDYFATKNTGVEVEMSGRVTRGWRVSASFGTSQNVDYDRWKNTAAYVLGRKDEFRQVLERAGGIVDTTQKNPTAPSAPGLAIANPSLPNSAIAILSERDNAIIDYNNIWTQYDLLSTLPNTVGDKKRNVKILTDYTIQTGALKGLRFGVAWNFVNGVLAGYRSADTIANPAYNPALPTSAINRPWIDDPKVGPNDPIYVKQPTEFTVTVGYSRKLRSTYRLLNGSELILNFIVRNALDTHNIIRQDTGLALRPPGGDLSLPYRTSVPSRVAQFQRPINVELTTTLKL
jgi:hypothetical protein